MTENEAIERIIRSACSSGKCYDACLYGEGNCEYDAAIIALKEVQQYREIGTVEECREAVEKQRTKKPVKDKYHHKCCPNCGWVVSGEGGYGEEFCPHCENCGQAIQWENLEGMEDEQP